MTLRTPDPYERYGAGGTIGGGQRALGVTMSRTQTPDSPRTSQTGTDDRVFHYVRKAKIAESAVLGTMVEALCGEVFPVTRAPKPGSPVCPTCREIYQSLPGD